mgnify:CR=1 FL=1
MGYDREHLSKLLEFVRMLYNDPANAEFAQGLKEIVGTVPSSAGNGKIDKIEKYLALDYDLDTIENPDYAFIKDDKIRNTLNADWREMMRCRYGLRGHKENFGEFARCAHLQMEMLLDIYYTGKYGDADNILKNLQLNATMAQASNPKVKVPDSLNTWAKAYCLQYETGHSYKEFSPLIALNGLRNDESHRSQAKSSKPSVELTYSSVETALSNLTNVVKEAMTY